MQWNCRCFYSTRRAIFLERSSNKVDKKIVVVVVVKAVLPIIIYIITIVNNLTFIGVSYKTYENGKDTLCT